MDKSSFKQYKIIWLTLPYNIVSGKSVIDVTQDSGCHNLFTKEQIKEIKKEKKLYEELKMYGISDIMNFYCNKYHYSIVSISCTDKGYFLITLLKD